MAKEKVSGYKYSRAWFDFAFENVDKVTASHGILFLWLVEINNRLGWVENFQITAKECQQGMSCKSYNTYKKCFNDLVEWGFIKVVKQSVNQYQCNVIALSKFDNPLDKALDKALNKAQDKALDKATETFINHKPQTINHKPINGSRAGKPDTTPPQFLEKYNEFLESKNLPSEKFSLAGRAALKKIYVYLKEQCQKKNAKDFPDQVFTEEELIKQSIDGWAWVLSKYDKWESFHQKQIKLEQINSNLLNIINHVRNGKPTKQQADQERRDGLDDLKRDIANRLQGS